MGLGSIILAVFAFLCMIAGALFVMVPFLGTMLSFLSPVLAITGVVLGGVALSRAKQGMGESEGLATAGLVLNIVAFVPAMFVALTCGLCNTLCTGAYLQPSDPSAGVPWDRDGGVGSNPIEDLFAEPDSGEPPAPVPDPQGTQGSPDPQGAQGSPDPQGAQGSPDPQGAQGSPDPQGAQGASVTPRGTPSETPMQRRGDQTPLPPPPLPPGPAGALRQSARAPSR
ncbi:MAG: hypothetical protein OHK0013_21330 [Sandaracinaceae bacterium]